jgi:hypothetical protein
MKLSEGTIRPGTVMEVLENGVIKASAPGLFNFSDDPNLMPPIMPWFIGGNDGCFSQPKQYDEVWIMNFSDNPQQLYWFRKDKISDNTNLPISETNIEILCNRDVAGEWCTIYFSDGSGWIISKGESIIQIRPNGSIQLNTGFDKRCIDISPAGISLGSVGKSSHPAAYGDVAMEIFNGFLALLKQIQMVSTPNPYTAPIGTIIAANIPLLESKIPSLVSSHVTLE